MASTLCQKWLTINFFVKKLKILYSLDHTILFKFHQHVVQIKYLIGKSIFAVNLTLKLFPATIANADFGSLKFLHMLFDQYLGHMLVKFEQTT